jgi:hypothetical protein
MSGPVPPFGSRRVSGPVPILSGAGELDINFINLKNPVPSPSGRDRVGFIYT